MMSKPLLHLFTQVVYTGQVISDWACSCGSDRTDCFLLYRQRTSALDHHPGGTKLFQEKGWGRRQSKQALIVRSVSHTIGANTFFLCYTMRTVMG